MLIGSEAVSSKLDPANLTSAGRTLRFPGAEPPPREGGETSPRPLLLLIIFNLEGLQETGRASQPRSDPAPAPLSAIALSAERSLEGDQPQSILEAACAVGPLHAWPLGGSSLFQRGCPPGPPVTEEPSPNSSAVLGHTGQELDCTQAGSSVHVVVAARLPSPVRLFATPWPAAHQAPLSCTVSWSLLKFTSVESVMPSNHLIICRPLLLPSVFPSIRACGCIELARVCLHHLSGAQK